MAVFAALGASALTVETDNLRLVLYEGNGGNGRIGHLYDMRTGYDYASQTRARPLWLVECRRADDYTKKKVVAPTPQQAGRDLSFTYRKIDNGWQLEYAGFADCLERVVCRVTAETGVNGKLRWEIETTPKKGWATYETDYPSLPLTECLGDSAADDCTHAGTIKGGVNRNPCDLTRQYWKSRHYATSPGQLSSPYACFYDPKGGLYCAAEDAEGHFKGVLVDRWWANVKPDGTVLRHGDFLLEWRNFEYSEKPRTLGYPIVMRAFGGTDGAPTDWRDAADVYREWVKDKPWYKTKLADRKDLPDWIRNGPAKFKFNRAWYAHKGLVQRWIKEYREKRFPGVPFLIQTEGWEHHGDWVTPEYFPCYPSDEAFRKNVADLKASDCHVWAWPGGHHWNVRVGARADGTFNLDYTDTFEREVKANCCTEPDGQPRLDDLVWLGGGTSATLCPATDYGRDWWNTVCCELVSRGVELVQADQDVGAQVRACWNRNHPHAPGDGQWMYQAMRRQFETQLAATRKIDPKTQFSFEECNEMFNDIGCVWDYRNCRFFGSDWASVFCYLHHEFVSLYQPGSELWGKWHWIAHSASDGQIPSMPEGPEWYFEMPVIGNGSFENPQLGVVGYTGWNSRRGMQTVVTDDATDGRYSLGLVSTPDSVGTNAVQVWTTLSKWLWQRYGHDALRVSLDVKVRKPGKRAFANVYGQMQTGCFGSVAFTGRDGAPSPSAVGGGASTLPSGAAVGDGAPTLPSGAAVGGGAPTLPRGGAVGGGAPTLPGGAAVGDGAPTLPSGAAVGDGAPTLPGWKRVSMNIMVPKDYKYENARLAFYAEGGADCLVDNVVLEYRGEDGVYHPVLYKRSSDQVAFAERWIDLFHANAKWLQHGRHLHPPKMECAREIVKENFRGHKCDLDRPCVYVGAFRAADGSEALFFVNATDRVQPFAYTWHGKRHADELAPRGLKLVTKW